MKTKFDFSGAVVLITGGGGGIAAETARLFHEAGATVIVADIDVGAADEVATRLGADGPPVSSIRLDVTDPESLDDVAAQLRERYGAVDHVIAAAGIYPTAAFASIDDEQWHRVIAVNLDGVFMLIRRMLPLMRSGGSIVTVASVAAHRGSRNHAHYAASKAGVVALTRSLALEVGPKFRVNAVSPGTIETRMIDDLLRERGSSLLAETPMGRNGLPRDVASAIAFLASDAASFVHGEVLHVNGGLFMAG